MPIPAQHYPCSGHFVSIKPQTTWKTVLSLLRQKPYSPYFFSTITCICCTTKNPASPGINYLPDIRKSVNNYCVTTITITSGATGKSLLATSYGPRSLHFILSNLGVAGETKEAIDVDQTNANAYWRHHVHNPW